MKIVHQILPLCLSMKLNKNELLFKFIKKSYRQNLVQRHYLRKAVLSILEELEKKVITSFRLTF